MQPVRTLAVTLGLSFPFLPPSISAFNTPGFSSHCLPSLLPEYPVLLQMPFLFIALNSILPDQSLPLRSAPTCRLTALRLLPPSLVPSLSFPIQFQLPIQSSTSSPTSMVKQHQLL